jgi:hypothetical protein
MSSLAGMEFGDKHQDKYSEIIDTWADKDISDVSKKLEKQWGTDLFNVLADPVIEALLEKEALAKWTKAGLDLPSKDTLKLYSQTAAKYALSQASPDLLKRLVKSVKADKENPPDTVTAAARVVRPSELAARSPQTLAQMYDMAKDKFNSVLSKFLRNGDQLTGKRQWITFDKSSRHRSLDNVIIDEDEQFTYKKQKIDGPRPIGGNPADWSNCSCRILFQRKDGKWVDPG